MNYISTPDIGTVAQALMGVIVWAIIIGIGAGVVGLVLLEIASRIISLLVDREEKRDELE